MAGGRVHSPPGSPGGPMRRGIGPDRVFPEEM